MEKGDTVKYLIIVLVFVGLAAIVLVLRPSPTGYAILEDYTNQSDCEIAGYTWEELTEENCTTILDCVECEPDCVVEYTEVLCEEGCVESCVECEADCQEDCDGIPECVECEPDCVESCVDVIICEPDCVTEYTEVLCEEGCEESCEDCVEVIIGGQCVGEICDIDNLNLCDDTNCTEAGGYWYDDICNEAEQCVPETDTEFCSRLGDECGDLSAADNCGDSRTVDCGSCGSGYTCESGSCEEDGSSSDDDDDSSDSSEDTQSKNKNLVLSGQDKVLVSAGSSEEAELHVLNVGKYQLSCDISNENWISSEEKIEQLSREEEADIKYKVSVPTGTDSGEYSKELIIKCTGGIRESMIIDVTVVAGDGTITGDAVSGSEDASGAGITGGVIGAGGGRVIAYVVFLLVLAGAVVLVWKRHAQIKGLDDLLLRGRTWFNMKFHRG